MLAKFSTHAHFLFYMVSPVCFMTNTVNFYLSRWRRVSQVVVSSPTVTQGQPRSGASTVVPSIEGAWLANQSSSSGALSMRVYVHGTEGQCTLQKSQQHLQKWHATKSCRNKICHSIWTFPPSSQGTPFLPALQRRSEGHRYIFSRVEISKCTPYTLFLIIEGEKVPRVKVPTQLKSM